MANAEGRKCKELLNDPLALLAKIGVTPESGELASLAATAGDLATRVHEKRASSIRPLVERVTVRNDRLTITLASSAIAEALGHRLPSIGKTCDIDIKVRLTRTGLAMKLVSPSGRASMNTIDNQVVGLLQQASEWWQMLNDDGITAAELARREDVNDSYVTRIIRLNFLAPDIVQSMLDGSQPAMLNAQRLKAGDFSTSWKEQRELYGFLAK